MGLTPQEEVPHAVLVGIGADMAEAVEVLVGTEDVEQQPVDEEIHKDNN